MLEGGSAQIVANLWMRMEYSPHNERMRFRYGCHRIHGLFSLTRFCKSLYMLVVVVVLK